MLSSDKDIISDNRFCKSAIKNLFKLFLHFTLPVPAKEETAINRFEGFPFL